MYQPSEQQLHTLGFIPDKLSLPYEQRSYTKKLPSGTTLMVQPRPTMSSATEFDRTNLPLFLHYVNSLHDLEESCAGRGNKRSLANPRPHSHG
jgi:hypothetical protein